MDRQKKDCQTIAVANQKGGVGKTTTAMNLSTTLAYHGKRVLMVDLDPQGNATTGLGISKEKRRAGNAYTLMMGDQQARQCIVSLRRSGLDVVPSLVDLAAIDVNLPGSIKEWKHVLKIALRDVLTTYDYVIVDCPPSLGCLTVNVFVFVKRILIPMQCEFFALEGLSHLLNSIKMIRGSVNKGLSIDGVLLTMKDGRSKLGEQVEIDVRKNLGKIVYETVIPRNVRLSEAPSHGQPIIEYDPRCPGARAYFQFTKEFMHRNVSVV